MNTKDKYIVISAALQLAAIVPLFAIALSVGRMVEKIDAHEKRLDRLEENRFTAIKPAAYNRPIGLVTSFFGDNSCTIGQTN